MSEQTVNNDFLLKAEGFWNKNQKAILGVVGAAVVVVGGWFGYQQFIVKPKEEKAADAIYKAEKYFGMDSANWVLKGDGSSKGVLDIIKNYGGTKAANLAHFYAGVSYLKLKDYNNAIKYLKDFSTDAKQVQTAAYGALADAYAETGKKDEALSYYKKAANHFTADEATSSEYLFRVGLLQETMGKNKEALEAYKELKQKYPSTEKGYQIDKYIYRLSIEKNDLSIK